MTKDELIEALADKEHASWARWMEYLLSTCDYTTDGRATIPAALVSRWEIQAATRYRKLSEPEKQSDRDEVQHILPIIEAYADGRR